SANATGLRHGNVLPRTNKPTEQQASRFYRENGAHDTPLAAIIETAGVSRRPVYPAWRKRVMPKMLDTALSYAKQEGIPVFPCRTDDKSPLTPNGFKDATTDEKQIRIWWAQYPSAMIGMPTGEESGCWVLDTDLDVSKNIDGPRELDKLIAKNGPLPTTRT